MTAQKIKKVVIVGGGTAGWIAAALLARMLGRSLDIRLIESEQISSVGVGEATIPPIIALNNALGIDESEFLRATKGSIKLGIQFNNWGRIGDAYMHAFGSLGKDLPFCSFHHIWRRSHAAGSSASFWDYSLNYQAAMRNKFAHLPLIENTRLRGLVYAYHFDAGLYARYLRNKSEAMGVVRIEAMVDSVQLDESSGNIRSLQLKAGGSVEADLFIDCSGFRGLLIDQALGTAYEDWSKWLPCNRAVAVQTENSGALKPYTQSIAHRAGWRWQIPLQHRTGNGVVFCNDFLTEDKATQLLVDSVEGALITEPRVIAFNTGRRVEQWRKNCVSVGLSSGFLEPLESTSIHLIQSAIIRLIKFFPRDGINQTEVDQYNKLSQIEFEQVRDFIILHYHLNQRDDSELWRYCRNMSIPGSLADKIELFKQTGKIHCEPDELFSESAWQQVFLGQNLVPKDYHPLADALTEQQQTELLINLKTLMRQVADKMPSHQDFIDALVADA